MKLQGLSLCLSLAAVAVVVVGDVSSEAEESSSLSSSFEFGREKLATDDKNFVVLKSHPGRKLQSASTDGSRSTKATKSADESRDGKKSGYGSGDDSRSGSKKLSDDGSGGSTKSSKASGSGSADGSKNTKSGSNSESKKSGSGSGDNAGSKKSGSGSNDGGSRSTKAVKSSGSGSADGSGSRKGTKSGSKSASSSKKSGSKSSKKSRGAGSGSGDGGRRSSSNDGRIEGRVTEAPAMAPSPIGGRFETPVPTGDVVIVGSPTTSSPVVAPVAATPIPTASSTSSSPTTGIPSTSPTGSPTIMPVVPPTVQLLLTPYALEGGSEFRDATSYQSIALSRVEDQVGSEEMPIEKLVQYYSLFCIQASTTGKPNAITEADVEFADIDESDYPPWIVNTGWLENDLDPCDGWFGLTCEEGKVVTIDLFQNNLIGNFPREIILLANNLKRLDVSANPYLFNNADNSWIEFFGTNLEYLYIEGTSFAGDLPKLPSSLREFDASSTLINGGLTSENFEGLDSLSRLELNFLNFNQPIPTTLAALPSLEFLYMAFSGITGDLSFLSQMTSIAEIALDGNPGITGTIPSEVASVGSLQVFSAASCGLTGTVPSELGDLVILQKLILSDNNLTGTIPTNIGNPFFMNTLLLEGNDLTGIMPDSVCQKPFPLEIAGVDCEEVVCPCCTCCSFEECSDP